MDENGELVSQQLTLSNSKDNTNTLSIQENGKEKAPSDTNVNASKNDGGAQSDSANCTCKIKDLINSMQVFGQKFWNSEKIIFSIASEEKSVYLDASKKGGKKKTTIW